LQSYFGEIFDYVCYEVAKKKEIIKHIGAEKSSMIPSKINIGL
jgi:hypothetical protein